MCSHTSLPQGPTAGLGFPLGFTRALRVFWQSCFLANQPLTPDISIGLFCRGCRTTYSSFWAPGGSWQSIPPAHWPTWSHPQPCWGHILSHCSGDSWRHPALLAPLSVPQTLLETGQVGLYHSHHPLTQGYSQFSTHNGHFCNSCLTSRLKEKSMYQIQDSQSSALLLHQNLLQTVRKSSWER